MRPTASPTRLLGQNVAPVGTHVRASSTATTSGSVPCVPHETFFAANLESTNAPPPSILSDAFVKNFWKDSESLSAFITAHRSREDDIIAALLQRPLTMSDSDAISRLHETTPLRDIEIRTGLLCPPAHGPLPLAAAIMCNLPRLVGALVRAGASPHAYSCDGNALHHAAARNNVACAKEIFSSTPRSEWAKLLNAGLRTDTISDMRNNFEHTSPYLALDRHMILARPLEVALDAGHLEITQFLLSDEIMYYNSDDDAAGEVPSMSTACREHTVTGVCDVSQQKLFDTFAPQRNYLGTFPGPDTVEIARLAFSNANKAVTTAKSSADAAAAALVAARKANLDVDAAIARAAAAADNAYMAKKEAKKCGDLFVAANNKACNRGKSLNYRWSSKWEGDADLIRYNNEMQQWQQQQQRHESSRNLDSDSNADTLLQRPHPYKLRQWRMLWWQAESGTEFDAKRFRFIANPVHAAASGGSKACFEALLLTRARLVSENITTVKQAKGVFDEKQFCDPGITLSFELERGYLRCALFGRNPAFAYDLLVYKNYNLACFYSLSPLLKNTDFQDPEMDYAECDEYAELAPEDWCPKVFVFEKKLCDYYLQCSRFGLRNGKWNGQGLPDTIAF